MQYKHRHIELIYSLVENTIYVVSENFFNKMKEEPVMFLSFLFYQK